MEKKDYFSLQSKYALVADCQERYRKELLDFINEAFEMHGNEFEYKCDTHATWQEKKEAEEASFYAPDLLPVYLMIEVDDYGRRDEIYIYRIRQTCTDSGNRIVVDGYDLCTQHFVLYWDIYSNIESLMAIAAFINAVSEQKTKSGYPRDFNKNEQVAVSEAYGEGYFAIVEVEQHAEDGEDIIGLYPIGEDGKCSLSPRQVKAKYVYQAAEGKVCPGCGSQLYLECNTDSEYEFYCPNCQGIFFDNEVQ